MKSVYDLDTYELEYLLERLESVKELRDLKERRRLDEAKREAEESKKCRNGHYMSCRERKLKKCDKCELAKALK